MFLSPVRRCLLEARHRREPRRLAVLVLITIHLAGIAFAVPAPQIFRIIRRSSIPRITTGSPRQWGLVVSASALCSLLITRAAQRLVGWRSSLHETVATTVIAMALPRAGTCPTGHYV